MPIFFVKFSCLCNDCIKLNFNYSWDTQSFSLSQHYKETVTTTLLSFVMSLSIKMFSGLCKDQLTLNKLIFTNKLSAIMGIKKLSPYFYNLYFFKQGFNTGNGNIHTLWIHIYRCSCALG